MYDKCFHLLYQVLLLVFLFFIDAATTEIYTLSLHDALPIFAALVSGMEGRPVTLRTFDIGGDKLPEALAGYAASDIANPALGLRAIRLSLRDRRLLDVQLAAMLRAAARGPVRIMLPMVSTVSEVRR